MGRSAAASWGLVALLLACLGVGVRAQVCEGEILQEVRVDGRVGVDTSLIRKNLRSRAGEPARAEVIDADMRWLHDNYGIIVDSTPCVDGVLTFVLKRILQYQEIRFEGNSRFTDSTLRKAARLVADRGATPSEVEDARRLIEEYYLDRGHVFVELDLKLFALEGGARGVTIRVFEGPSVEVDTLKIEGLTALDDDDAESLLSSRPGFWAWLVGKDFERKNLDRDVLVLEEFVQREGYKDASVSVASIEWSDDREEVDITLHVDEGERYRVRSIRVEGNTEFTDAELLEDSPMEIGEPYRDAEFERLARGIREKYGEVGFIDAKVSEETLLDLDEPLFDVVLRVDERQKKKVRDVIVRGNVGTRDGVIRRYMTIYPGDVVDTRELRYSEDSLISLNYFTDLTGTPKVRVITEPTPDDEYVDIIVEVDDSTSGLFSFVIGAGSDSGVFGGVSVDKRNFDISRPADSVGSFFTDFFGSGKAFHGGGQRLFLEVVPGTEVTNIDIVFQEPWIDETDDSPWGYSVELYRRRRLFSEYTQDTTGFGVFFSHRFDRHHSISIGPRVETVEISDVDDTRADIVTGELTEFAQAEGRTDRRLLEGTYQYTDLDSLYEPTKGWQTRFNVQSVGGPLGGDVDATRVQWTSEWFAPISEDDQGRVTVFHPRIAIGIVEPNGGRDLPFFENFFVGGGTGPFAVRGFDFQGVGPRQEIRQTLAGPILANGEGDAIGGRLATVASLEAVFPLLSERNLFRDRDETIIKGVLFLDAGNLLQAVHFNDLSGSVRASAGAGLRLRLPALGGITVLLDYATVLREEEGDDTRNFSFELSRRF